MASPQDFRCNFTHPPEGLTLEISGSINEAAFFPQVPSENLVRVNLAGVTRLNSVGTRSWCLWMGRFRKPTVVELINCPVLMARNFTLINGFLNECCVIRSFAIPYYSDETGQRKDFMAILGTHFDQKGNLKLPPVLDSKGKTMELDVIPEDYFGFLRR